MGRAPGSRRARLMQTWRGSGSSSSRGEPGSSAYGNGDGSSSGAPHDPKSRQSRAAGKSGAKQDVEGGSESSVRVLKPPGEGLGSTGADHLNLGERRRTSTTSVSAHRSAGIAGRVRPGPS